MNDESLSTLDTQLITAIELGLLERVKILIDEGANPRVRDDLPLITAVQNNQLEIADFLLQEGVDPRATALRHAILRNYPDMVELLLHYGADPSAYRTTTLSHAVEHNYTEIVRHLFDYGVDLGLLERGSPDPLFIAIDMGNIDMVELLLERGVNPNRRNFGDLQFWEQTAIRAASRRGITEIVALLLEYGADPSVENNRALEVARNDEIRILLLDYGAQPVDDYTERLDETLYRQALVLYQRIGDPILEWLGPRRLQRVNEIRSRIQGGI